MEFWGNRKKVQKVRLFKRDFHPFRVIFGARFINLKILRRSNYIRKCTFRVFENFEKNRLNLSKFSQFLNQFLSNFRPRYNYLEDVILKSRQNTYIKCHDPWSQYKFNQMTLWSMCVKEIKRLWRHLEEG